MKLQRGKHANLTIPEISDIREVSRADLSILTKKRSAVTIQTIRDNHHRVARCMASGMNNIEIAEVCGIGYNRVSMLRADPSMQELVAHYRSILTVDWAQQADHYMGMVLSNRNKAEAMLSDKLDAAAENDEFLPTRDLIAISRDAADRTGYGKVQKNVNINVDFAARLEKARAATEGLRTIESVNQLPPTRSPSAEPPARIVPPQRATFRRV